MGKSALDITSTLCLCILFLTASSGIATVIRKSLGLPRSAALVHLLYRREAQGAGMVAM